MTNRCKANISYIIFNSHWDTYIGNTINQSREPLDEALDTDKYFTYLENSLLTLKRHHDLELYRITIWLVELQPDEISGHQLMERLTSRIPGITFDVHTIGYPHIQHLIQEAREVALDDYRSPNELHELLLFFILEQTPEPYLLVVDCDVLFIKDAALDYLLGLLKAEADKVAGAFLEQPGYRPFLEAGTLSRERMHSVMLVFDVVRVRELFDLRSLISTRDFMQQVALINNQQARQYYRRYMVKDTLSFFTEYLKDSSHGDLLLNLNTALDGFHEGGKLTILCDYLVHAKYLESDGRRYLRAALESLDQGDSGVQYALQFAGLPLGPR